jgi:hypothetical protein
LGFAQKYLHGAQRDFLFFSLTIAQKHLQGAQRDFFFFLQNKKNSPRP